MKFNIKNLFNKKSLRKLEKATLVGVASLALIVPLAGNTGTSVHAAHHSHYYYENLIYDPGSDCLSDVDEMQLIMQHPFLKHTHIVKAFMSCYPYWDGDTFDFYVRHFKQLYSPYLYPSMAKRVTYDDSVHYKHDNYVLYRTQVQMGLIRHRSHKYTYRRARHIRRIHHGHRHYSHKRHENHRRNARKHRSHRYSRR